MSERVVVARVGVRGGCPTKGQLERTVWDDGAVPHLNGGGGGHLDPYMGQNS